MRKRFIWLIPHPKARAQHEWEFQEHPEWYLRDKREGRYSSRRLRYEQHLRRTRPIK